MHLHTVEQGRDEAANVDVFEKDTLNVDFVHDRYHRHRWVAVCVWRMMGDSRGHYRRHCRPHPRCPRIVHSVLM